MTNDETKPWMRWEYQEKVKRGMVCPDCGEPVHREGAFCSLTCQTRHEQKQARRATA